MSELQLNLLEEIQQKVERLKQELKSERVKVQELEAKAGQLQQELTRQKNALSELEETNKMSKLAGEKTLLPSELVEHKKQINQYIREIETCIRLLSD